MVVGDTSNGEVTGLRAAAGEDDAAGLGPHERRDLVTGLFDGPAGVARGLVAARRVADHAALPGRHGVGDFVAPGGRRRVVEVVLAHATKKVLTFVNSRTPNSPSSRPKPESFVPPKGSSGIEATRELAKTIPTSRPAMAASISFWSVAWIAPPRPHGVSLAKAIAASRSSTTSTTATGPKSSSQPARVPVGTLVNTVAGK